NIDLANRGGVFTLVGGLHQIILEFLMLLLLMFQLAFEPPPRRPGIFKFLFDGEVLFDRFRELALKLGATRGKRFDLFLQPFDFDVGVLERDEMAQFGIQNCLLIVWSSAFRRLAPSTSLTRIIP